MATTPTQMRLTESDLSKLDRIKRIWRLKTRTSTVRNLIEDYLHRNTLIVPKRKSKKSSVAT